jgi:hypothetical protein
MTAQANPESKEFAFPPRSASRKEEMEKRSRQRIRDQVAHMAFGAETRMRSSARVYPTDRPKGWEHFLAARRKIRTAITIGFWLAFLTVTIGAGLVYGR